MLAGGGWDGLDDCVAASVAAGELGPAAADQTATGGFDRRLRSPCAVVPGRAGTGCFFVCDLHSVRRVDARTGHIQTMAGCGEPGACSYMQPPRSCLWLGSYRLRSLWPAQLNPARGASGFCDGAPAAARFSWDLSYTIPIGCVLLHGPPPSPVIGRMSAPSPTWSLFHTYLAALCVPPSRCAWARRHAAARPPLRVRFRESPHPRSRAGRARSPAHSGHGRCSRRRDCPFTDTSCLSLLKHLMNVQGGCHQMTVSPTATVGRWDRRARRFGRDGRQRRRWIALPSDGSCERRRPAVHMLHQHVDFWQRQHHPEVRHNLRHTAPFTASSTAPFTASSTAPFTASSTASFTASFTVTPPRPA